MDYLRCGTREQSSDQNLLKPYSRQGYTRWKKAEGQDGELRKGAVRIGSRGKEGLELGGRYLGHESLVVSAPLAEHSVKSQWEVQEEASGIQSAC